MNNTATFIISLGLVFLVVSCKEQKTADSDETPKTTIVVKKNDAPELTKEEKRLKTANKKLGWIMQDMEVPEYKLDELHEKGDLLTEDYLKYSKEMIDNTKKFNEIDHPDEKLVKFANEMLEAMKGFETAISTKNKEAVKVSWQTLIKTCAACHKVYKKGGGGY